MNVFTKTKTAGVISAGWRYFLIFGLLVQQLGSIVLYNDAGLFMESTQVYGQFGGSGPVCGNDICESGETAQSCPADCGPVCGNGICESGETTQSCSADCAPSGPATGTFPNDLSITKTLIPQSDYAAGGIVQFELEYTNTGPNDISNITIQDSIPSGLSYAGAVPAASAVGPTNLTRYGVDMVSGETGSIIIDFMIDSAASIGTQYTNSASIGLPNNTTTQCDGCEDPVVYRGNGISASYVYEAPQTTPYNLSITKNIDTSPSPVDQVMSGDIITFTLTVENSGYLGDQIKIVDFFEDWNMEYIVGSMSTTILGLPEPSYFGDFNSFDSLQRSEVPLIDGSGPQTITLDFKAIKNFRNNVSNYSKIGTFDPTSSSSDGYGIDRSDETDPGGDNTSFAEYSQPSLNISIDKKIRDGSSWVDDGSSLTFLPGDTIKFKFDIANTSSIDAYDVAFIDALSDDNLQFMGSIDSGNIGSTSISFPSAFSNYWIRQIPKDIVVIENIELPANSAGYIELDYIVEEKCGSDKVVTNHSDITFAVNNGYLQVRKDHPTYLDYEELYLANNINTTDDTDNDDDVSFNVDLIDCVLPPVGNSEHDWMGEKGFVDASGNTITTSSPGIEVIANIDAVFVESGSILRDDLYIADERGSDFQFNRIVSNDDFRYFDDGLLADFFVDTIIQGDENYCIDPNQLYFGGGLNDLFVGAGPNDLDIGEINNSLRTFISAENGCGYDSTPTGNTFLDTTTIKSDAETFANTLQDFVNSTFETIYATNLISGMNVDQALIDAYISTQNALYVQVDTWLDSNIQELDTYYEACYTHAGTQRFLSNGHSPNIAMNLAQSQVNAALDYSRKTYGQILFGQIGYLPQSVNALLVNHGYDDFANVIGVETLNALSNNLDPTDYELIVADKLTNRLDGAVSEPALYYLNSYCDQERIPVNIYDANNPCASKIGVEFVTALEYIDLVEDAVTLGSRYISSGSDYYAIDINGPSYLQQADVDYNANTGVSVSGVETCEGQDEMTLSVGLLPLCPATGATETYTNNSNVSSSIFTQNNTDYNTWPPCDTDDTNTFCGYQDQSHFQEVESLVGMTGAPGVDNMSSATLDVNACTTSSAGTSVSPVSLSSPANGVNYTPGETFTYTVEVCNEGSDDLTNIYYAEKFNPLYLTYTSTSSVDDTVFTLVGDEIQADGISLVSSDPNDCVEFVHTFTVNSAVPGTADILFESTVGYIVGSLPIITDAEALNNVATFSGHVGTDIPINNGVQPLTSSKNMLLPSSPSSMVPGSYVVYTLSVSNDSQSDSNDGILNLYDFYSENHIFDSVDGGSPELSSPDTSVPGTLSWEGVAIPDGATLTVDLKFQIDPNAEHLDPLYNEYAYDIATQAVPCTCSETALNNNSDTDTVTVTQAASFDLALDKKYSSFNDVDMSGGISPGDEVTFFVNVYNQGDSDATNVVITDYIPTGMSFVASQNTDFAPVGSNYESTIAALPAGSFQTLSITLAVDAGVADGTVLTNNAEITAASGGIDEDDPIGGADNIGTSDDITELSSDNDIDDEAFGTPGTVDNVSDQDDYDLAQITVVVPVTGCTNPTVTVTNGELTCTTGTVTLTASGADAYEWPDGSTGSTYDVTMTGSYAVIGYDSTGVCSNTATSTVTSVTSSATITGVTGVDPSACGSNDGTITVSATSTGDGTLEYSLDNTTWQSSNVFANQPSGSYTVYTRMGSSSFCGEVAIMTGSLAAPGAPTVTVNNATLSCGSGTATLTASGADSYVWSNGATTETISVTTDGSYTVTGSTSGCDATATADVVTTDNNLTLAVEGTNASCGVDNGTITATASTDVGTLEYSLDGTVWQASNVFNGLSAQTYTVYVRNGSTTYCEEITETIVIESAQCVYDLALIKQLQGTTTSFLAGDDVTFDITVTNQGEVVANTFTITDYFPTGLTLNDTDWSNDGTLGAGTTDYTYNGTLATGASTTIPITFTVNGAMTGTIINRAEISADDGDDSDSTPDTTNGTTTESPTDDTIDNESGDEDDHDPASITVSDTPFYDLALTKVLSGTQTVFQAGDVVTFDITVYNQGTIDAQSFTITDYIPSGLSLDDTAWTATSSVGPSTATYTGGPLVAGNDTVVPITFVLNGDALGDLTNRAEISADDGDDSDSTPDTTNDTTTESPTDDTIDNESGDEDDHDPASITVVEFDLALDKILTSSAEAEPGSTVTFDITVYNQGTVDAANVVITDYVPAGLTLADSNWTTSGQIGPGMITYPLGSLAAGSNQTISVSFVADSNQFGQIINWSEISAADPVDENGDILTGISDIDSTPDADQFNSDGETNDLDDDNIISEDGYDVANDGDEDDHDPAVVTVGNIFDLALTKVLSGSEYVEVGDVVTFEIYVENQGGVDAQNIVISDYFPVGLTLSDSDWTNNGVGAGAAEYMLGALDAGDNTTISITFEVNADTTGQITNRAEISAADPVDENGNIITSGFSSTDIDSTPDAIAGDFDTVSTYAGDDVYGSDNNLAGNGTDDEDDHDPAQIFIAEMDLALTKIYDSYIDNDANGTLTVGDDVIFAITLYNQGNVDATNIVVTDYVPAGLMVQDPNRTNNGVDGAISSSYTYAPVLFAGDDDTFTITLRVNGDEYGEITNRSEISGFDALDEDGNMVTGLADIDSTPDTDENNDIQPSGDGDVTDNTIDQDGKNGGDEDDHDPAAVSLGLFDLALTKHLVDESPYRPGDIVTFDIVLYNQGTIDATDIVVTDYIPAGLTLTGSDWTQTNGIAQTTYTDTLPAMSNGVVSTGSVSISFVIDTTTIGQIINRSEITSATDLDGNTIPDVDSTPDADQYSNDGETDDLDDDDIIDNTNGDEDDHDPAVFEVLPTYDLALTKINTIPGPNTVVYPGDQVQFEIEVFNQGNSTATDIQITDYIPTGLTLDDQDWTLASNGNATYSAISSLASAASETVTIDFVVNQYFSGQAMNRAEISDFSGSDGSNVDDRDSTPDDINFNQDGETDDQNNDNDINNEDGDEDDHDPAGVYGEVYDLALIKTLKPGSPSAFGSGDFVDFVIQVSNQGTLTGTITDLVDHFPAGLTLQDPDWTAASNIGASTASYDYDITLAPGASMDIEIGFYSNGTVTGDVINRAEIAGDDSATYGTTDTDSTPDTTNFNQDGETNDLDDDNINNEDGKNGGDEDDHDPEMITLDYFDLALTKVLASEGPFYPGSEITFDITITNQGTVATNMFEITDYIPAGLTLVDDDWMNVDATQATYMFSDTLDSLSSVVIPITFVVDDHILGTLTNRAEISADDGAYLGGDRDSTPDDDNTDPYELDNDIDSTDGDEDDHDPADITIDPYFDLALVKYLTTTSVVEPGDIATFEIKVTNQGNIVGEDIVVTDYIPDGMRLADLDWTDNGDSTATYAIPTKLPVGQSEIISISLQVDQYVNDLNDMIVNRAEISADNGAIYGNDVDSMPDSDNFNQDGETNDLFDDGVINEDGKNGGDEDDHDPAVLPIGDVYDLALIKTINTQTPGPYYPGSEITYDVTITNQGNMPASDIEVTDYIPVEMTLVDADWDLGQDNQATYTLDSTIAPGTSETITITLQINQHILGPVTNWAEISDDDGDDVDSNPDDESVNDVYDNTNDIVDNTNGDEDDHDPAVIEVEPYFDLALTKVLNGSGSFAQGDLVTFDIEVTNQGNIDAQDIEIIDYIPTGLALSDADWLSSGLNAVYTIPNISAGSSVIVPITLSVVLSSGELTNWAEISEDNNFDEDSIPDERNGGNSESTKDNEIMNVDEDEDDHDRATIDLNTVVRNSGGNNRAPMPTPTIPTPVVSIPTPPAMTVEEMEIVERIEIIQVEVIERLEKKEDHLAPSLRNSATILPAILPQTGSELICVE